MIKGFTQYLIETFNNPYKLNIRNSNTGKIGYFKTDDDREYEINGLFIKYINKPKEKLILKPTGGIWEVHFDEIIDKGKFTEYRRNDITGRGDAFRVFSTIFEFIKSLVSSNNPEQIIIKSKMSEINRGDLYSKMVKKYASLIGYKRTNAKIVKQHGNEQFAITISKIIKSNQ